MRFLRSSHFTLSSQYPKTDTFDIELKGGEYFQIEASTFRTPPVKMPFSGIIPVVQRFVEYGPDNVQIQLDNGELSVYHEYVQAKDILVNIFGDDTYQYTGEVKPVYADMLKLAFVTTYSGQYEVTTVLQSNGNVLITINVTSMPSTVVSVISVTDNGNSKEYNINGFSFSPVRDSEGHVLRYTASVPRFYQVFVS